jgi:hypothetical protein
MEIIHQFLSVVNEVDFIRQPALLQCITRQFTIVRVVIGDQDRNLVALLFCVRHNVSLFLVVSSAGSG